MELQIGSDNSTQWLYFLWAYGRFSDVHEFEKPNDAQALNLMNACAVAVVEAFRDVVFAYGVSDEYRSLISFHIISF